MDDERQGQSVADVAGPPATDGPAIDAEDHPTELERLVGWFDRRLGIAAPLRVAMAKVFPDHWSFLLGEIALFCFVILVLTGTFLTFFYTADSRTVTYAGPYTTLDGSPISAAYDSVLRLSFEVRAGLLMRQVHHWTALLFLAAIGIHLARVFLTGAYRRPRELNWVVGVGLLLLALGEGVTGYSLPDDLLSGTGLRIIYSAALSVPFIGPWAASLIFGGTFPATDTLSRLFVLHVMLLPALLAGGVGTHLAVVWLQKHTQYRGGAAREDNVVGLRFWPGQTFRSAGLFMLTAAVLVLVGGLVQINPVWLYGPYVPYLTTVPAQPDWYAGWLEGALRMGLPIEPTILGVTIPALFVPGVLLPGILVGLFMLWPFLEARFTGDRREHHLLDYPWETPVRTATGVAAIGLFLVLTLAGGNDVIAKTIHVPVESLTDLFRILTFVAPVALWLITYLIVRQLRDRGAVPGQRHPAGYHVERNADGGFVEVEG
jgi:ubiquinol-cytochrome c reductase cytochrome b subunit